MGIYEYMMLSEEEQWDELWDEGKHLCNYQSIDAKFVLYALHKFFVDVELCVTTDKILGKHVFVHGHRMEKYLGKIYF